MEARWDRRRSGLHPRKSQVVDSWLWTPECEYGAQRTPSRLSQSASGESSDLRPMNGPSSDLREVFIGVEDQVGANRKVARGHPNPPASAQVCDLRPGRQKSGHRQVTLAANLPSPCKPTRPDKSGLKSTSFWSSLARRRGSQSTPSAGLQSSTITASEDLIRLLGPLAEAGSCAVGR